MRVSRGEDYGSVIPNPKVVYLKAVRFRKSDNVVTKLLNILS